MKNKKSTIALEALTWDQVRDDVRKVNPDFADVVDALGPDKKHALYKVRYHYGDEILQRGKFYFPSNQQSLIPFDDPSVPADIQDKLGYNGGSNPGALVLNNSLEFFITLGEHNAPYAILQQGAIFGLWKMLDRGLSHCPETFLWGLTAGSRSLFMLPKISETVAFNRIKHKYHLKSDKPNSLLDHWEVFRELTNQANGQQPWHVDLLLFSKEWFVHQDDRAWIPFNYFLLDKAWQSSSYWRNQYIWTVLFSLIQQKRHIRPSPYVVNVVKHLLAIGIGALPGYAPALDDSQAPIKALQDIFVQDYNIKYPPIIMQPHIFSLYEQTRPVYYSLQFPAMLEFSLKSSTKSTAISDLYDVSMLIDKYLHDLQAERFNIESSPLHYLAEHVQYSYYHSKPSKFRNIVDSGIIANEDPAFMRDFASLDLEGFPKNSKFFNGCIRISK